MASAFAKKFRPPQRCKSRIEKLTAQLTKAQTELKQLRKDHSEAIKLLDKWQAWAQEYKDATTDAYQEAERANTNRQEIERLLMQINQIMVVGDRGAATALQQIQTLCDDYWSTTATNNDN